MYTACDRLERSGGRAEGAELTELVSASQALICVAGIAV